MYRVGEKIKQSNMKIEDQVCTLGQAKKLKELGIDQETEFYFRMGKIWHFREVTDWPNQEQLSDLIQSGAESERIFAAYTVAELGEMLPTGYDTMKITVNRDSCEWQGYDLDGDPFPSEQTYKTEAEVRATMLIALIEAELLTVEEINNRLK